MGLLKVKEEVGKHYPGAVMTGLPTDCGVVVTDCMLGLFAFGDREMTTTAIARALLVPYERMLGMSVRVHTVVLVGDKAKYVPRAKLPLQQKRNAQWHKADPEANREYADGCKLTPEGIYNVETRAVELVRVSRLMHSRHLRPQLFNFIIDSAINHAWPEHAAVIVDLNNAVPYVKFPGRPEFRAVDPIAHRIGEGDLAVIYWLKRVHKSNADERVSLFTIDTDTIPLVVYHYWNTRSRAVWQCGPDVYWEVDVLVHQLKACGWSREMFVVMCILSGCDWFNKGDVTNNIGHTFLWNVMGCIPDPRVPEEGAAAAAAASPHGNGNGGGGKRAAGTSGSGDDPNASGLTWFGDVADAELDVKHAPRAAATATASDAKAKPARKRRPPPPSRYTVTENRRACLSGTDVTTFHGFSRLVRCVYDNKAGIQHEKAGAVSTREQFLERNTRKLLELPSDRHLQAAYAKCMSVLRYWATLQEHEPFVLPPTPVARASVAILL